MLNQDFYMKNALILDFLTPGWKIWHQHRWCAGDKYEVCWWWLHHTRTIMLIVVALAIYTMQQILSPRNKQMDKPILGVGFIFNQSIQNIPNIFTNIFLSLHLSGIKVTFMICDYSCEGGPLKGQNIMNILVQNFQ